MATKKKPALKSLEEISSEIEKAKKKRRYYEQQEKIPIMIYRSFPAQMADPQL